MQICLIMNPQSFRILATMAVLLSAQTKNGAAEDLPMFAGCGDCDPNFEFDVPTTGLNTDLAAQPGGIRALFLLHNSSPFLDPTDAVEWAAKLEPTPPALPKMIGLNGCYNTGGLEQAPNTETLGSCQITLRTFDVNTLTFEVIEDNTTNDIWKQMRQLQAPALQNCFQFAYTTCDGVTVGFFEANMVITRQIETTKAGKRRWTIVLTWDSTQDIIPLDLAFNPLDLIPA